MTIKVQAGTGESDQMRRPGRWMVAYHPVITEVDKSRGQGPYWFEAWLDGDRTTVIETARKFELGFPTCVFVIQER